MKFNERLRELRQQSPIMQKDIAEILGISTITLRQYEQGTREPNIDKLLRIAILFNVSLDDLLCLADFKSSLSASSDEH
ncbi:MAG: helix-turn-helix transcriptional regulator [Lachnospiraceae bacterium]|jgi:transcriptional regulator with XRE-family HTH domain|nr:helix-turn-helix transcriptional regulator [Lachnospiraceae bacterium]